MPEYTPDPTPTMDEISAQTTIGCPACNVQGTRPPNAGADVCSTCEGTRYVKVT